MFLFQNHIISFYCVIQSDRTGSIHRFDADSESDKLRFQAIEASSEDDPSQPADFIKVSRAEYEKLHKEL